MRTKTIVMRSLPPLLAIVLSSPAFCQNTTGVFGPIVKEGHSSAQYRATYNPENEGFAQRIHYQESLNDDFMWRAVVATHKTAKADADFDFFQAELLWDLSENESAWRTGVRFDLTLRSDDRSELLGIHWTNQYNFSKDWSARFIVLSAIEFGENAQDGMLVQTRASVTRKIGASCEIGLELYNFYGSLKDWRGLSEQVHQAGPIISGAVADDWNVYAGVLFGLNDHSAEYEPRLWLTHEF